MDVNSIVCDDCFNVFPSIDSESVDLIVCDGPYGVSNQKWDNICNIQEYNLELIKIFYRILSPGGSLYLFGKHDCIDFVDYRPYLKLQSKIIWYQPSRLSQGKTSYTNNYDVICYFTKGNKPNTFNIDDIRIPQMVELEHRKRCEDVPSVKEGKYKKTKYNPKGKNPGNVWGDIKQLTYKSKELVSREVLNTIQKPKKLMERLIKASTNESDMVLDPFFGTGTTLVACKELNRNFIGVEQNENLCKIANERLEKLTVPKT